MSELTSLILSYDNLQLEGVMSHLADSDGQDIRTVQTAVAGFDACVEAIRSAGGKPTLFHIGQSAGSLRAQSVYANAVRLGIGLYGLNPFADDHPDYDRLEALQPALRLITTITAVHDLGAGEQVGYNYTFTAPKAMRIAVIPLGYYEGINRALSNVGTVMVNGHDRPIVGRICMNHTMISLEGTQADVGDEVVVYAADKNAPNSIDRIAQKQSLFNYNLLTALSSDVRRQLVD